MPTRRLYALGSLCLLLVVCIMGCESSKNFGRRMIHEMKPHRLHRWNQGDGPNSDPHFSVEDTTPARYPKNTSD